MIRRCWSCLPDLCFVGVVAVEGTHAPVVLEEPGPLPVLVDFPEQQFALDHQHPLVPNFGGVDSPAMPVVDELGNVPALPAFQQILMGFVLVYDVVALCQCFHQQFAIAQLVIPVGCLCLRVAFFRVGAYCSSLS